MPDYIPPLNIPYGMADQLGQMKMQTSQILPNAINGAMQNIFSGFQQRQQQKFQAGQQQNFMAALKNMMPHSDSEFGGYEDWGD